MPDPTHETAERLLDSILKTRGCDERTWPVAATALIARVIREQRADAVRHQAGLLEESLLRHTASDSKERRFVADTIRTLRACADEIEKGEQENERD